MSKLQHTAKAQCVVVSGIQGTGKTTFVLRYIVAARDITCRFIFDGPLLDMSERLGLSCAQTEEELDLAVDDGFVIFDSSAMFPGDKQGAFEWFARWSYNKAGDLPGRKVLLVDEVWRYCSPNSIPKPLSEWVQDGRKAGKETIFCTQTPNKLHDSIINERTEGVCFRLQGRKALDRAEEMGFDRAEVESMPYGSFVAVNYQSGAELHGRLW